jgi:hypothetical protein
MISARLIACAIATTITASIAGQSQQSANPTAAENKASADNPPIEILSHKIGPEYYRMLDDRDSTASRMSAENGDLPRLPNEPSPIPNSNRDRRAQGRRPSSYSPATSTPQLIQVVIKNTGVKQIKVVEWDFLFPHCENGQFVPRYDATTMVKIKPGGQKTLKRRLSPVASGCVMPKVISIDEIRKQERISIKRIEYVDGLVWQRR